MKILTSKKEAGKEAGLDAIILGSLAARHNLEKLCECMLIPESKKDKAEQLLNNILYYLAKTYDVANTLREV